VTLANGSQAVSRTVVIATGVSYRRLPVPGLDITLVNPPSIRRAERTTVNRRDDPAALVQPVQPA